MSESTHPEMSRERMGEKEEEKGKKPNSKKLFLGEEEEERVWGKKELGLFFLNLPHQRLPITIFSAFFQCSSRSRTNIYLKKKYWRILVLSACSRTLHCTFKEGGGGLCWLSDLLLMIIPLPLLQQHQRKQKRKENDAGIFQRKDPSIFFSFPSLTFQPDRGGKTFPGRGLYFVQDSFASYNGRGESQIEFLPVRWFDSCCSFLVPATFFAGSKRVGMKYFFRLSSPPGRQKCSSKFRFRLPLVCVLAFANFFPERTFFAIEWDL